MKRIKNFFKRNLKYSIAFIIGILVHLVVYASTTPLYTSNQIGYDNSNSGLEAENVKDALDALYNKAATCDFGSGEDNSGGNSNTAAAYLIANESSLVNVADAYRYSGTTSKNYVWFNNEQWRIIGVYDNKLKIVRNTPLSEQRQYNSSTSSNAWNGSSIQTYLNNTYYSTLSSEAKGMIYETASWNVGAVSESADAATTYTSAKATTWVGKIGMVAVYEYLYCSDNTYGCWSITGNNFSDSSCGDFAWLNDTMNTSWTSYAWFMNPSSSNSSNGLHVYAGYGRVSGYQPVTTSYYVSPVVYLKPDVTITGGTGQSGETNSYKLACSSCT